MLPQADDAINGGCGLFTTRNRLFSVPSPAMQVIRNHDTGGFRGTRALKVKSELLIPAKMRPHSSDAIHLA
jgi:hypothetical protein